MWLWVRRGSRDCVVVLLWRVGCREGGRDGGGGGGTGGRLLTYHNYGVTIEKICFSNAPQSSRAWHEPIWPFGRAPCQEDQKSDDTTRGICEHVAALPEKYYTVDSSHVKNAYGREGLGRSPVDRGRKGLKISVLTDSHGVVHNIHSEPLRLLGHVGDGLKSA